MARRSSSSLNESIFSIVCPERRADEGDGGGGRRCPAGGPLRAQLQDEAAGTLARQEGGGGRNPVGRCNFAKNKKKKKRKEKSRRWVQRCPYGSPGSSGDTVLGRAGVTGVRGFFAEAGKREEEKALGEEEDEETATEVHGSACRALRR